MIFTTYREESYIRDSLEMRHDQVVPVIVLTNPLKELLGFHVGMGSSDVA